MKRSASRENIHQKPQKPLQTVRQKKDTEKSLRIELLKSNFEKIQQDHQDQIVQHQVEQRRWKFLKQLFEDAVFEAVGLEAQLKAAQLKLAGLKKQLEANSQFTMKALENMSITEPTSSPVAVACVGELVGEMDSN